jgi:hypothetical protein
MTTTDLPPSTGLTLVVGCRGSGLAAHVPAGAAVPPPGPFLRLALARLDGRRFDLDAFLDVMYASGFRSWGVPDELGGDALDADRPADLGAALRFPYRVLAWHLGATACADATPDNVLHLHRIAGLVDEVRVVHVIADARGVVAALAHDADEPMSVTEAALHWRHRVLTGRALGGALGDRYIEVVGDGGDVPALSPAEVRRVEALAGDVLDDLGFERAVPSLRTRAGATVRRAGADAKRLVRRIRQLESAGRW